MEVAWKGLSDSTIHDIQGSETTAHRIPAAGWIQTGKHTGNWRKKVGCRQGSILGTGGRRVDAEGSILRTGGKKMNADREAYLELDEEGWM
jgi:hypothetical protein